MERLNKREDESLLSYFKRVTDNRVEYDLDYAEWAKIVCDKEYSSDNARKAFYVIKPMLERIDDAIIENISDTKVLNELEVLKLEIEKERKKRQAVNVEINRNLRVVARNELIQEDIIKAIEKLKPLDIPVDIYRTPTDKEGIVVISDSHFGKTAIIKGLKGEVINEYNEDVFTKRMEKLLEECVIISKKEGIEKLNILLTGDLIDGILRATQLQKLQYGIIDSTMRFAEYISAWLNRISEYVYCDVYYCLGNHSQIRPLGSKNGEFEDENVERIIMWYLKSRLAANNNISIIDNDGDFIYFNCLGLNIMASHGEERNLETAIKDYMLLYGEKIDLFIGGHLHTTENKSIGINRNGLSDIEFCRVKSICSVDDYSMKLRKSSSAGTSYFVIEEGRGKTITYDIKL